MTNSLLKLSIYPILFIIFSCTSGITKKKSIWVLDNESDLTKDQILKLDSLYKDHERKTSNEIALVTTADYGKDSTILFYAVHLGRAYGVGKKDKNNGVVIVFSSTKHEAMISTGYGTEKVLKDEIAKEIMDSIMIPQFKINNNFKRLWNGSIAIIKFLERPENKIK